MRRSLSDMAFCALLLPSLLGASEPQPAASDRSTLIAEVSQASPKVQPPARTPAEWASMAPVAATAVIDGPTVADLGDLIVLDASKSDAESFAWKLTNSKKSFRATDGGKVCMFATGKAGKYSFILATAKGGTVALVQHDVLVGEPQPEPDPDNPKPVDPVFPDGKYKLADFAYKAAKLLADPAKATNAPTLGRAWESVASKAAAGAFSGSDPLVQMIAATKTANQAALGSSVPTWAPWKQAIEARLTELNKTGTLATLDDHIVAWKEIAQGLQGVKK